MMKRGQRGKGRFEDYLLGTLWLGFLAIAGFFFPYVIDSVSYFNISKLEIEGLKTIPPSVVSQSVSKVVKNNWLFLYTNKRDLVKELRQITGDAVEDVKISPRFSLTGVGIKLHVLEREPFIAMIVDNQVVLFDKSGYSFHNKYYKPSDPILYTTDISMIKDNFQMVYKLVSAVNRSGFNAKAYYITDAATFVYTSDGTKIVLPPVFFIENGMLDKLEKIKKIYNMKDKGEVKLVSDNVVVIKKQEDK